MQISLASRFPYFLASFLLSTLVLLSSCGKPRQVQTLDSSGRIQNKGEITGSKQTGLWTYWYENGNKQAEGPWVADEQEGMWSYWYQDGVLQQRGLYDYGLRVGHWEYFHPNGTLYAAGDYQRDRQHGQWLYYNDQGVLISSVHFVNSARHGWSIQAGHTGAWWQGAKVGPQFVDGVWEFVGAPSPESQVIRQGEGENWARWQVTDNGKRLLLARDDAGIITCIATNWNDDEVSDSSELVTVNADNNLPVATGVVTAGQAHGTWHYWHAEGSLAAIVAYENGKMISAQLTLLNGSRVPALPDIASALAGPAAEISTLIESAHQHIASARIQPRIAPSPIKKVAVEEAPSAENNNLTPLVQMPTLFSQAEWNKVDSLLAQYNVYEPVDDIYSTGERVVTSGYVGKKLSIERLFSADGGVINLKSYRDKKNIALIIMRGFAGQICVYCSTQTAALAQNLASFREANTEVILVYPGPAESVGPFLDAVRAVGGDTNGLTVALDINLRLVNSLRIGGDLAAPTSILIGQDGKIFWAYVGENMGDRPGANELLDAIAEQ